LDDGLARLNEILDAWGTQRLTMPHTLRTTHTLTSDTASYTVGIGGTINIVRPIAIDWATIVTDISDDPATEIQIDVLAPKQWMRIRQKALTSGLPQAVYYDRDWSAGLARLYPWPIPDVSTTQVVLYTKEALTRFEDLTTAYSSPPGYMRAMRLALAVELAPEFGGSTRPSLARDAAEALGDIKRPNLQLERLDLDPAIVGEGVGWNYLTGEYDG